MDSYEATRVVFSRIQNLDPDNASKIMGYLLIQDQGEEEMTRLAFGPDILIHNLIFKAKNDLGLLIIPNTNNHNHTNSSSNSPSNSRPSPLSIVSSRFSNNGGGSGGSFDISAVSSPHSPGMPHGSLSYANVVNGCGGGLASNNSGSSVSESFSSLSSSAFPYYGSNSATGNGSATSFGGGGGGGDVVLDNDYTNNHLSFLNESSTKPDVDFFDQASNHQRYGYGESLMHRRSLSLPAAAASATCLGSNILNSDDDFLGPGGWKPCMYFAKGFCKNGGTCKFVHGCDNYSVDAAVNVGSPGNLNEFEQCQELLLLRSKAAAAAAAAQQQRKLALAASQFSMPYNNHTVVNNKSMNFLPQPQNDSPRSPMGFNGAFANAGARQIYLTFPADSTFREEDVSHYFSMYGPVQDVRIPYQQKRMFGFVTFVYPDTVKMILAKGNPHFVCNSRVLVKPYKEKGKCAEKKQQQMERGDFSGCSSPVGFDSREAFDLNLGGRVSYNNTQEMMRRKLEEESDFQQAIEMHGRRLMNLKLQLNLNSNSSSSSSSNTNTNSSSNNNHFNNHNHFHHNLSSSSPVPSPTTTLPHTTRSHPLIFPLDGINDQHPEEKSGSQIQGQVGESENAVSVKAPEAVNSNNNNNNNQELQQQEVNPSRGDDNNNNGEDDKSKSNTEENENDFPESLEHILPDNLFASPKKSSTGGEEDHFTVFSSGQNISDHDHDVEKNTTASCNSPTSKLLPPTSNLTMAPIQSCFLHFPRFSSEHGTIGL